MGELNDIFLDEIDPNINYSHFSQSSSNSTNYFSNEQYTNLPSINNIYIMNYNIGGFRTNFNKFSCSLASKHFSDILCLTETWFSPNEASDIPGFHV